MKESGNQNERDSARELRSKASKKRGKKEKRKNAKLRVILIMIITVSAKSTLLSHSASLYKVKFCSPEKLKFPWSFFSCTNSSLSEKKLNSN